LKSIPLPSLGAFSNQIYDLANGSFVGSRRAKDFRHLFNGSGLPAGGFLPRTSDASASPTSECKLRVRRRVRERHWRYNAVCGPAPRRQWNGLRCEASPGALRAFGVMEPWRLRDAAVPASSLFRRCWPISREDEPQALAAEVEAYLIALQPRHDSLSLKASEIAQIAEDNLDLSSVASLADRLGLSQRSVQDAALRLEAEANVSLSGLAQALGYFDRAHFTRDFKRATGVNPGHYRLCIGAGAEAPA
jgi:hypothetical protein